MEKMMESGERLGEITSFIRKGVPTKERQNRGIGLDGKKAGKYALQNPHKLFAIVAKGSQFWVAS